MTGRLLEQLRKEAGLTQGELAAEMKRRLGRGSGAASTISMIESEDTQPRLDMVAALADYFNVPVDYLLGRTENRTPYPQGRSVTVAVRDAEQEALVREFAEFIVSLPLDAAKVMLQGQRGFWRAAQGK